MKNNYSEKANECFNNKEFDKALELYEKAIENKIRIHVKLEGKKICQFSKQGIKIRTWDSISSAARTLGIARTGIRDCCLNKQKSAFGYIWKYKNNESC